MTAGRTATVNLYMKNSSLTALNTTTNFAGWTAGATNVYTNTAFGSAATDLPAAVGWVVFNLSTPFQYSGGSIETAIDWAINAGTGNPSTGAFSWQYTTTSAVQAVGNSAGAPLTAALSGSQSRIYNTQLTFTVSACTGTPAPGNTLSSTTPTCPGSYQTTLSAENGTTGAGVTYQWYKNAVAIAGATSQTYTATVTAADSYYVAVTCGGNTANSTPLTVPAPLASIVPPYTNDFATFPGSCWSSANGGSPATGPASTTGTMYWVADGFLNNGTTGAAKINLYSTNRTGWLISPAFNLTAGGYRVKFDYGVTAYAATTAITAMGSDDVVHFVISTDGGTTWSIIQTWDSANTPSNTTNNFTYIIPAGSSVGSVKFAFFGSDGTVDDTPDYEFFVDNFIVETAPSCIEPSMVSVGTITATSAVVSWQAPTPAPALGYDIYYSTSNTAPTAGTVPNLTGVANPATISNLTANSTYYVWVRSRCSATELSTWTSSATFTTLCNAFAAPFTESFSTGALPSCWSNFSTNNSGYALWRFSGSPDYGTTNNGNTAGQFAWVDASSPYTGIHDVTLQSPAINLTGLTAPMLQFNWFKNHLETATGTTQPNYDNNKLTVQIKEMSATTWAEIFSGTTNDPNWRTEMIPLAASYANTTVQFRFIVDKDVAGNGYFYDNVLLDEVQVKDAPSCVQPSALTANPVGAFTATISWTAPTTAPANGYEYYYSTTNTAPTATTVPSGTSTATSAALSGLSSGTTYYFWVRSVCSATAKSDWSTVGTFTTTSFCPTVTAPTDGATGVSLTPTITWNAVPGATSYTVTIGTTPGGTDVLNAQNVGNVTTYTLATPLNNSTVYYLTVNATDGTNTSTGCTEIAFSTLCAAIVPSYSMNFTAPVCWDVASGGTPATGPTGAGNAINYNWEIMDFLNNPANGDGVALNLYSTNRAGWLLSPVFDLSAGGTNTLTFNYGITEYNDTTPSAMGSDDQIQVLMSTDGGTTWTSIQTWTVSSNISNTSNTFTYVIPSTSNQVKFAIYGTDGTVDDSQDYEFHVDNFIIDHVMSTGEVNLAGDVTLYPNPFTDYVAVNKAKDVKALTVFDVSGRMVKKVAKIEEKINTSDLQTGMYVFRIEMKDGSVKTVKAIKR